jgi:AT-binding transcription factor 1
VAYFTDFLTIKQYFTYFYKIDIFLQALMMQMMTGGQFPPGPLPTEFNLSPPGNPGPVTSLDNGLNPEAMEPPPEPAEPNPRFLFNCCVCKDFSCDSLEILSQHLTVDRSRSRSEEEVSVVIAGNKFMAYGVLY